jgi:murein DD-endopeptidase MepM/ murein hydrolase activator NlpD
MAEGNKWTILVLKDAVSGVSQCWLSRELMRTTIAFGLLAISLAVSLTTQLVMHLHGPQTTARLVRANSELKTELKQINGYVADLNEEMATLSRKDEYFRQLAGLDPLGKDVRLAGIGGPDSETQTLHSSALWKVDHVIGETVQQTNGQVNALIRQANLLSSSWEEARDSLRFHQERLARTPSIMPTDGYISSGWQGLRYHPLLKYVRAHKGIDIGARKGTAIVATAKGRIHYSGRSGEYGLMVEIDHGFDQSTRYAHASKLLVRRGQLVERGDTIALVGSTGLASGPHVHYEVRVNGRAVNPRKYMRLSPVTD